MSAGVVLDSRGGMILADSTSHRSAIMYDPACWDGRIADWTMHYLTPPSPDGDEEEEEETVSYCDQYDGVTQNMRGVCLYVDSVPGGTEAGDGTEDNPFTCLNSALRWIKDSLGNLRDDTLLFAATTGCPCTNKHFGAKIYLTGTVDYPITNIVSPNVTNLVIIGNGDTKILTDDLTSLLHFAYLVIIQNCYIDSNASEGARFQCLFENCEIHTDYGFGLSMWSAFDQCDIYLQVDDDHTAFDFGHLKRTALYANSVAYDEEGDPMPIMVYVYSEDGVSRHGTYAQYIYEDMECEHEGE